MRKLLRFAFPVAAAFSMLPAVASAQADTAARRQQRTIDSLAAAMRTLQARVDSGAQQADSRPAPAPARAGAYMNTGFDALTDFGWSTTRDVPALQRGDHDPKVRGFTVPNVELTFDAAVDPYFKGFSALVFKIDPAGETSVELEEASVQTTALPGNLQIKAGQILGEFGRQNAQHPHAWAFVDQPLALNQMFGADGLRGQGAKISWLAPTSWYTEAMITVLNSNGETAFSFRTEESADIHGGVPEEQDVAGFRDLLFMPRVATSVDLTETQTIVAGASGAFGPNNSGSGARSAVFGIDLYWKWKAVTAQQGFPFLSLQSEWMSRQYDAAARTSAANPTVSLPAETLDDWGAYSQLLWGIKPRIVAGLRGELIRHSSSAFATDLRTDRERWSPTLTWYPTEFSKLRLQYNLDHRAGLGTDHSLWLQLEFMMGAHAAHKF